MCKVYVELMFLSTFTLKSDLFSHWKTFLILWCLILHLEAFLIFCQIKMLSRSSSKNKDTSLPLGCISSIGEEPASIYVTSSCVETWFCWKHVIIQSQIQLWLPFHWAFKRWSWSTGFILRDPSRLYDGNWAISWWGRHVRTEVVDQHICY